MPTVNSFPVNPGWKLLLTNADINTTKVPRRAYLLPVLLSVFLMAGAGAAAGPDTTSLAERTQDRRLAISAGVFLVRFDSTYKYSDAGSLDQAFVDFEGQLDLPSTEVVGNINALWRFTDRSYLTATFSRLRRSGERRVVQETIVIEDDLVRLDGVMSARLDYDFLDVNYAYAFYRKEQSLVLGKAGVHIFSSRSGFLLEGELEVNGVPETGKIGDEADFVAAFPLIGAVLNYQLGRRLFVENVVDFVYLPVGDTQAVALRSQLGCRYMIAPWVGLRAGLSYNFERVEYTEGSVTHEVEFDFSGIMVKAYLAF
jgi:hypothetical protein